MREITAVPLEFHPRNPFRPPWWRSGRARALAGGDLRPGRLDDSSVRRARRYLIALGRHGGEPCHQGLISVDPAVAEAYRLIRGGRERMEVEARLLAGQDDGAIAACVGLHADVVAAFAALFFDVRGSLEKVDWIATCVLGERLYDGSGAGDEELALRLVGYNFGGRAVDAFLGRPVDGIDVARVAEALRRYILAATAPVTTRDAPRYLALVARMAELERVEADSRMAAASGPIHVRGDVAAMLPDDLFAADRSAVRAGFELRRTDDDDPAINIPSIVAMSPDDLLDRRSA